MYVGVGVLRFADRLKKRCPRGHDAILVVPAVNDVTEGVSPAAGEDDG